MPNELVDLVDVQARLRDYERQPLLRLLDDIELAKRIALFMLDNCRRKSALEGARLRTIIMLKAQTFCIRGIAVYSILQASGERAGLWQIGRIAMAGALMRLSRANC